MTLITFWFIVLAVFWTGFLVLEGFDFGVGMLHGVVGRDEQDRGLAIRTIGAGLGRQRGLADRRRGRDLRRLPRLVRDHVLRLLPGLPAAAGGPDRPRGVVRVPRQARQPPLAAVVVPGHHRREPARAPAHRHGAGQPAARGADRRRPGVHRDLRRPAQRLRPVHRASRWCCSACPHGASFLALKTVGELRDAVPAGGARARPGGGGRGGRLRRLDPGHRRPVVAAPGRWPCWPPWRPPGWSAGAATGSPSRPPRSPWPRSWCRSSSPSTPGSWSPSLGSASDLTVSNTSSSPYALKVMTVAAAVLFPVVLAYQAWTYHVFRSRVR